MKKTWVARIKNWIGFLKFVFESIFSLLLIEPVPFKKVYKGKLNPGSFPFLCIFSHYDKHSLIDDYILFLLKELHGCGCEIIFVSTCQRLRAEQREKIEPYCTQIALRWNTGKDLGSYKFGIRLAGDLNRYDLVLFVNDSIYGPLAPLQTIFEFGQKSGFDFWGVTDSWQNAYHLQGYFVVFKKNVFLSRWFKRFWNSVRCLLTRSAIVQYYEIGMTKYFQKRAYQAGAWCPYLEIKQNLLEQSEFGPCGVDLELGDRKILKRFKHLALIKKHNINPCSYLWDILIAHYKFPFVKRDLIQFNPDGLDTSYWTIFLKQNAYYDCNLIVSHLKRVS